jgi:hypothetical protein
MIRNLWTWLQGQMVQDVPHNESRGNRGAA